MIASPRRFPLTALCLAASLLPPLVVPAGAAQAVGSGPAPARAAGGAKEAPKAGAVDLLALFKMHWEMRVRAFREQNLQFRNVVLLGDSITEGFEVNRYFPGRRVLNRGIGGDVIGNGLPADDPRGVLRRLDASVFDCAATDVFLMIGINDLNTGRTPAAMEAGYRELLRRIKERTPGVRVYVQSLLPTRGSFAARNPAVRDFNARLAKLAGELGYPYLDLHAQFADDRGELKPELTADGLHLTEAGYRLWRREVLRRLDWSDEK